VAFGASVDEHGRRDQPNEGGFVGSELRQCVRYLDTVDGVRLAWSEIGAGPVLVKASNWLTHLEHDMTSPVWRHWIAFFGELFRFVRYDERGCGMTDWGARDLSWARWVADLEAVVEAADIDEPFVLLGISQGAASAVSYTVDHPERVARLILNGGYARGWARRGNPAAEREYQAIHELILSGWGRENAAFRQIFTSRFIPGGSYEQLDWFNDLCRKTTTPEIAGKLLLARGDVDVVPLLREVRAPTLVLHARDDAITPIDEGRLIAAHIPNAEFVELESKNHVLLEDEPAWRRFQEAVLSFTGLASPAGEDPMFAALSAREREVLTLLTQGLGNAAIAESLSISDKTVRNHLSNIFDKLGVWTRAQAIVFARDRGFRA
jgi:pimeloyl-ACP methyl ester carboxylesterase/DNA-binding CsgD family transcriptional regulator